MKIVVDTNIVFSAILNIDSNIAKILINSKNKFDFYSCEFLKNEIYQHKNKILKITGYNQSEFLEIEYLVIKNISFLNHKLVGRENLTKAKNILKEIDVNDAPFFAMAKHLKAKLWTGDKVLINGLNSFGYKDTITTKGLLNFLKKTD